MTPTRFAMRFALLISLSSLGYAHDLLVVPAKHTVTTSGSLPVSVYMTERYIQPGRMPDASTQLSAVTRHGTITLPLAIDTDGKRLHSHIAKPDKEMFWLAGNELRERQAREKELKDTGLSAATLRMQSFSKALINAAANTSRVPAAIGTRLEVLPLQNPATLGVGDTLTVKILLDGQPLATRVQASYDGFSDKDHGYVVRTESSTQGIADIPLSAPGQWMIRAKWQQRSASEPALLEELSANMVFSVR